MAAKNRTQVSQQLVSLLNATGKLGSVSSAFEASLAVENYLVSGRVLPIAAVQTLDAEKDREFPSRYVVAKFRIGFAGQAVTEAKTSNYLASGGSSSSQQKLEATVQQVLTALNSGLEGFFTRSDHGFQGRVTRVSNERLVVAKGTTYDVCDVDVDVYDCTVVGT